MSKSKKWLVTIQVTDSPRGEEKYLTKNEVVVSVLRGNDEAGITKKFMKIEAVHE